MNRLRTWFARCSPASELTDPEVLAEVQDHLDERRDELSHWLFVARTGFALGLAGYLGFSALMTGGVHATAALLALAYAAVNAAVRFAGGRRFRAAPWIYALIDFTLIVLLRGLFASGPVPALDPAPFGPNVAFVGLLVLMLLAYTVLGNPTLNAMLSLASLASVATVLYLVPALPAEGAAGGAEPVRSFLLIEYLSIACLVTCLLALRLRRRIIAHSAELHRRMMAAVESTLEQKRREELEEVNHLKRDFISVLSHELRNPITPLVSSLEIVQADLADDHYDPELIEVAADAAHELQRLICDYTRLAELLNRPLNEANRWNVPLRPLVDVATEQIGGARFTFEHLEDRAAAGDPSMLCGALHAVMRRAAQQTPAGRPVTVRAEDAGADGLLSLAVHDPCSYLEPETTEALNDPFISSRERLFSKDSTGLELILAQHALRRVGGRLRVESDREGGTTVRCLLPTAVPGLARLSQSPLRTLCTESLPGERVFVRRPQDSAAPQLKAST